ncbi:MAG: DUF1854 domain-containing protein [Candidatus Omnitrophota bacterium]|nr:DUF1854 domain-containing protein [Candidatus Omnitrophota bacterium]
METDNTPTVLNLEGVGVNFLALDQMEIIMGFDNFLYVVLKSGPGKEDLTYRGVFAVLCFPVTCPHQYVSLRYIDTSGEEREIGVVRDPSELPAEARRFIAASLANYYFEFEILRIFKIELRYNLLMFDVGTDHGPRQFEMHWRGDRAQNYGKEGKVLFDIFENRYIVRDIRKLSPEDQELFTRFIYW